MSISCRCTCGHRFAVRDALAGKRVKCPVCGEPVVVPAPRFVYSRQGIDLSEYGGKVECLASGSDAQHALAGVGSTALLLDLVACQVLYEFKEHEGTVRSVALSPDGRLAASAGGARGFLGFGAKDMTIRVWELAAGKVLHEFASNKPVTSLAFSPDGRSLLFAGLDAVRLWDLDSGEETVSCDAASCAVFSPNGSRILCGGGSDRRAVRLMDLKSGKQVWRGRGESNPLMGVIRQVGFSANGRLGFSAGGTTMGQWNIETGKALFAREMMAITCAAFNREGRLAVTAGGSGEYGKVMRHPTRDIDDREMIVCGNRASDVMIWDLQEEKIVGHIAYGGAGIVSLAFLPNGTNVICGTADGRVRVGDVLADRTPFLVST